MLKIIITTILWVHGFESIDQMVSAQADPFWNKFESKFKKKPSELLKESQSKKSGIYYFKTYDQFGTGQGKYVILNDGKVKDIKLALDWEKQTINIFGKRIEKIWNARMGSCNNHCTSG